MRGSRRAITAIIERALAAILVMLPAGALAASFDASYRLTVQEDYNDNVFLSQAATEDFITRLMPGAGLKMEGKRLSLSLDYGFEQRFYMKNTRANDKRHTGRLKAEAEVIENLLHLDIGDDYTRVPSDIRRPTEEGEVFVNLLDTNMLRVSPYIRWGAGPLTDLRAGYEFLSTEYEDTDAEDTRYNNAFFSAERRLSAPLTAKVLYERKAREGESRSGDFTLDKAAFSLSYQASESLKADAYIGNGWFDYDLRDDEQSLFWDAGVRKDFQGGSAELRHRVELRETPLKGPYRSEGASLSLKYGGRVVFTITGSVEDGEYLLVDRADASKAAGIGVSWAATRRMDVRLGANGAWHRFTSPDEEASHMNAEVTASYRLIEKRLALEGRYRHTDRDSTIGVNSYTNNIVTVLLRFTS